MIMDEAGFKAVEIQRALYTNPEFVRHLCYDICTEPPYDKYSVYARRLDSGLYLMGWRIEQAPDTYKTWENMYITSDEMTPFYSVGGAVGADHIMWRSAAAWAKRVNFIYRSTKAFRKNPYTSDPNEFLNFYEEYLLP